MADNATSCLSDNMINLRNTLALITYTINLPFYLIIGLCGNGILIAAFYKQSKKEKTYAYQVFLTVSKILEVFFTSLFMIAYKWYAGIDTPGSAWFMRIYPLMFYAAHMSVPIFNSFIILSLYLSVSMAADRVFAVWKPLQYKAINHKQHQVVAVACCIILAIAVDIFEVNTWVINPIGDGDNVSYRATFNNEFLSSTVAVVMGNFRVAVQLFGLVLLVSLNLTVGYLAYQRSMRVGVIRRDGDQKEQRRQAADRSILSLTITQSCLLVFGQLPHTCHLLALTSPGYGECSGEIVAPLVDMCIEIADAIDFFVIISINERIRRTVAAVIPCRLSCYWGSAGVNEMSTQGGSVAVTHR